MYTEPVYMMYWGIISPEEPWVCTHGKVVAHRPYALLLQVLWSGWKKVWLSLALAKCLCPGFDNFLYYLVNLHLHFYLLKEMKKSALVLICILR